MDDQDEEKINNRLSVYRNETAPVADHYKSQNKFNTINGTGTIDDIYDKIDAVVSSCTS